MNVERMRNMANIIGRLDRLAGCQWDMGGYIHANLTEDGICMTTACVGGWTVIHYAPDWWSEICKEYLSGKRLLASLKVSAIAKGLLGLNDATAQFLFVGHWHAPAALADISRREVSCVMHELVDAYESGVLTEYMKSRDYLEGGRNSDA